MPGHAFDIRMELRAHGSALRRLAVELVGEQSAAEDAVQEVWLRALRNPPRRNDAVGGWLATLLHNVARSWRRQAARRTTRELAAQRARGDAAEDHALGIARAEVASLLADEVARLEPHYREVICRRYFEGLSPRAIARATGEPLATIKSRLQRGLNLLRARLAARKSDDWRGSVAASFGLAAGPAIWTGALTMAGWTKGLILAAAAAIGCLVFWPPQPALPAPQTTDQTASLATRAVGDAADIREEPSFHRDAVTAPAAEQPLIATIRGRCVDAAGRALSGCAVRLSGSPANTSRMEAWLRDHAAVDWTAPAAQTTTSDGAFELRFSPPPPFQFYLGIDGEGLVRRGTSWPDLAPGTTVDLGDVKMRRGVRVRGRVVDRTGAPVDDVQIDARCAVGKPGGDADLLPEGRYIATRTATNGSFEFAHFLPPGLVTVGVSNGCTMVTPNTIELAAERPLEELLCVVELPDPATRIDGRVVDEQGAPIVRAMVSRGGAPLASTDPRGSFAMYRREGEPAAGPIEVTADGFETWRSDANVTWGTHALEIRLQRAAPVVVHVADAAGRPVTRYSVRLIGQQGSTSSQDNRVRARGPFADGVAEIPGVAKGSWVAILEFPADSQLPFAFVPFELAGSAVHLHVRADAVGSRRLRIVDRRGAGVAGAKVRLVDTLFGPIRGYTSMLSPERLIEVFPPAAAAIVFEGVTDASGEVVLRARGARGLKLLTDGGGCLPLRLDGVRLDEPQDLVLTTSRGARLTGRIVPEEAFAEVRRRSDGTTPLTLELRSGEGPNAEVFPGLGFEPPRVGADGSFDCDGLPPGSWQVSLRFQGRFNEHVTGTRHEPCGEVHLTPEATTHVDLDLSRLFPGELRATVIWNGEPLRNAHANLAFSAEDAEAANVRWSVPVRTDAAGSFAFRGQPGTYSLSVCRLVQEQPRIWLRAATSAHVTRELTTEHEFAFTVGELRIKLLDAAGNGVAETMLRVGDAGTVTTDANGSALAEVNAGDVAVTLDGHLLGAAHVVARATTDLELRLPPK